MKKVKLDKDNMKAAIAIFSDDQEDYNRIWNAFYMMACMGFVTDEEWRKFADECDSWVFEDGRFIDADTGEAIKEWSEIHEHERGGAA